MGTAFYFLIVVLPIYIEEEMNADNSIAGIVLSMYTIASLLIRPFSGVAVDSLGRKFIFIWSFFIFSLLFGLYGFVWSLLLMGILRFLHGLTWGVATTSGATIAVDIIPASRRGEGIGYYGFSITISMAIGPAIGLFLSDGRNYENMFFIGIILNLVGFILLLFIKYPSFTPFKENVKFKWKNLFESKSLVISLNILLTQATYGGLVTFVVIYGKEFGIGNPGLFFVFYAGAKLIGRAFSGRIFDKEGPKRVVTIGFFLMLIGFVILSLMRDYNGFLGSAAIMGFGYGISISSIQAMVNNVVELHRRGVANSTYFTIFDLGIGLGIIFIGFVSKLTSISDAFLLCAGMCLLSLIYFLMFTLKYYRKNIITDL